MEWSRLGFGFARGLMIFCVSGFQEVSGEGIDSDWRARFCRGLRIFCVSGFWEAGD